MKTLTLAPLVLIILVVSTLASIIGQEVDILVPHTSTSCQTQQDDNGVSTTQCVTLTITGHIG